MITSVLSSMRGNGYKQAVATARQILQSQLSCDVDELLAEAAHAMNACRNYVKTGRLRLSYTPDNRPVIQIVTRRDVIISPSIQKLLMWAEADTVMDFLAMSSGIGVIVNQCPNDNPC